MTGATLDPGGAGEGGSPALTLDGFTGPLDHLLALARAQKIDLADISLATLVDQLGGALRQAPGDKPLGQKADWVVMAAWLVQLRSGLLLPAGEPAPPEAVADPVGARLTAQQDMHALAGWLARRPQLGHDVFARGRPEIFGVSAASAQAGDTVAFLWASLALFADDPPPDTGAVYRPPLFPRFSLADARDRIRGRLVKIPEGGPLEDFLPERPDTPAPQPLPRLWRRAGWSSTFIASLELARQGEVILAQAENFQPIEITAGETSFGSHQ